MKNQLKATYTNLKSSKRLLLVFLFSALCSLSTFAQVKTLTGTITDEVGIPLPGANILEKGTQNGVTTDFDGNYSIQVTNQSTITISYLGYKTKEVVVGSQMSINLSLEPDLQQLEETVVIGYGSVRRKDVTGSVASVKIDELTEAPVANFDQALAGRVTGVRVRSAGGGEPGSSQKIVIRGQNSITQSNEPLYVVDGFIVPSFNSGQIDPSDIESMSVLKDASATAIYGANGSNGVIIITTKKGKVGKVKVSYDTRLDVKNVTKTLGVLNAYDYVKLQEELDAASAEVAFLRVPAEGGGTQEVPGASFEDYRNVLSRDWQDEAFRTSFSKTHRLKVSGGNEDTRARLSLNSVEDEGTLLNSLYERIDGRLVIDQKISDKLSLWTDVNYQNFVQNGLNVLGTGQYSFLRSLITYRPVANIYRDYGEFNPLDDVSEELGDFVNVVVWHPIVSLENEFRKRETDRFTANMGVKYKISPNLTFLTKNSYNSSTRKIESFNNSKTVYGRLINPINGINAAVQFDKWKNFSTVNTLTYRKQFNDHSLEVVGGITYDVRNYETARFASNWIPEYLQELGMNAIDGGIPSDSYDNYGNAKNKLFSLLGRVNYSYKDKYLLTSSIRRDASSRFTRGNRSDVFPSLGLAWQVHKEKFIENLNIFSQFKLKAGYGQTGNERVGNNAMFLSLLTGNSAEYFFGGQVVPGQRPTSAAGNPDLQWETTEMVNLGAEMGFFDDRINVVVEVYQKDTKGLLMNADAALSQGAQTRWVNLGHMRNSGLEINFNTVNVSTKNFKWTSDFNITFNQNEVVEIPSGKPIFYRPNYYQRLRTNQYIVEEGKALGNMYGYLSDGVYQIDDFVNYNPEDSEHTLKATVPSYRSHQPGDEKFKDINGDGVITGADKTVIGNGQAKYFGGFNNSFKYKNFELGAFFEWTYGNDVLNANRLVLANASNRGANQLTSVLDRWTIDNQDTDVPRAGGQGFEDVSSRLVEDGSYIRLKTINFSYTFSKDLVKKLKISSLKLYCAAQNLVTWTNYSGYDPDVSVSDTPISPGIDYSSYPNHKTYSVGLNVTF
ncbi:SusC/RagA family TonB-linked outer membrane protein [Aestuariivivens insulae]|uniref:SusC/RagA family TonB-linked outer membrane protein n=1 Tax=Aestuariivivens insulae TaxID=1621988 RepID=UPI001F57CA67|nr:TonB-dependent receptor [Aestuariivivens insulae]